MHAWLPGPRTRHFWFLNWGLDKSKCSVPYSKNRAKSALLYLILELRVEKRGGLNPSMHEPRDVPRRQSQLIRPSCNNSIFAAMMKCRLKQFYCMPNHLLWALGGAPPFDVALEQNRTRTPRCNAGLRFVSSSRGLLLPHVLVVLPHALRVQGHFADVAPIEGFGTGASFTATHL